MKVLGKTLDSNDDLPRKPALATGTRREGDWIAGRLRRVYDEVRAEPLPEQFLVLLGKISRQDPDESGPEPGATGSGDR